MMDELTEKEISDLMKELGAESREEVLEWHRMMLAREDTHDFLREFNQRHITMEKASTSPEVKRKWIDQVKWTFTEESMERMRAEGKSIPEVIEEAKAKAAERQQTEARDKPQTASHSE
jgi:ribosomal protein L12E/L44/L45/RPP1/RPP2